MKLNIAFIEEKTEIIACCFKSHFFQRYPFALKRFDLKIDSEPNASSTDITSLIHDISGICMFHEWYTAISKNVEY